MTSLPIRSLSAIPEKSDQLASLLKVLANDRRLVVLCDLVRHGERSVGELEVVSGLSQSALSQHLAKMRQHGIVKTRRAAQTIFYSLACSEALMVMETLDAIGRGVATTAANEQSNIQAAE